LTTNPKIKAVTKAFREKAGSEKEPSISAVHYSHRVKKMGVDTIDPIVGLGMYVDVVERTKDQHRQLSCTPVTKDIVEKVTEDDKKAHLYTLRKFVKKEEPKETTATDKEDKGAEVTTGGGKEKETDVKDTPDKETPDQEKTRAVSKESAKQKKEKEEGPKLQVCVPQAAEEYTPVVERIEEGLQALATQQGTHTPSGEGRKRLTKENGRMVIVTDASVPSGSITLEFLARNIEMMPEDKVIAVNRGTNYALKVQGFKLFRSIKSLRVKVSGGRHVQGVRINNPNTGEPMTYEEVGFPHGPLEVVPFQSARPDNNFVALNGLNRPWYKLDLVEDPYLSNTAVLPVLKDFSNIEQKIFYEKPMPDANIEKEKLRGGFLSDRPVNRGVTLDETRPKKGKVGTMDDLMKNKFGYKVKDEWEHVRNLLKESRSDDKESSTQTDLFVQLQQTILGKYPNKDIDACKLVLPGSFHHMMADSVITTPTKTKKGTEVNELYLDDELRRRIPDFKFTYCEGHVRPETAVAAPVAEPSKKSRKSKVKPTDLIDTSNPVALLTSEIPRPVIGAEKDKVKALSVVIANTSPMKLEGDVDNTKLFHTLQPDLSGMAPSDGTTSTTAGLLFSSTNEEQPKASFSYKIQTSDGKPVAVLSVSFDGDANLLVYLGKPEGPTSKSLIQADDKTTTDVETALKAAKAPKVFSHKKVAESNTGVVELDVGTNLIKVAFVRQKIGKKADMRDARIVVVVTPKGSVH
jgi:hypothetical protein